MPSDNLPVSAGNKNGVKLPQQAESSPTKPKKVEPVEELRNGWWFGPIAVTFWTGGGIGAKFGSGDSFIGAGFDNLRLSFNPLKVHVNHRSLPVGLFVSPELGWESNDEGVTRRIRGGASYPLMEDIPGYSFLNAYGFYAKNSKEDTVVGGGIDLWISSGSIIPIPGLYIEWNHNLSTDADSVFLGARVASHLPAYGIALLFDAIFD